MKRYVKKILKLIRNYGFIDLKIAYKISAEKRISFKDALKELDTAKRYSVEGKKYYELGIYKLSQKYKVKRLKEIEMNLIVNKIFEETKKPPTEIKNLIKLVEKRYHIDYKEFYKKKYYKLTRDKCLKRIVRDRKIIAVDIANIMGTSIDEAYERLTKVCEELEISHNVYYEKKYYKMHEMDILVNLPWKKEYFYELATIAAQESGVDYTTAAKRMVYMKDRYGIMYSTYLLRMYYLCTEEEIVRDIDDYVQLVADETGWTYNQALTNMNRLKTKYGISHARYFYCRYFSVDDKEANLAEVEYKTDRYKMIVENAIKMETSVRTLYEDMRLHCLRYGDPEDYYFAKCFFKIKNRSLRDKYLHGRDGDHILPRKYNTKEGFDILFNKVEFNKLFDKQLGRKWWINSKENTYESFLKFIDGLDKIFVKPMESSRGRGCRKLDIIPGKEEEIYQELISVNETLLVEECIIPHNIIAGFGGGSVSSIRAIVLNDNDECNIISAYLRVGSGEVTDNISVDGVAIEIDQETGMTISNGVDKDGHYLANDKFSGNAYKGVEIPYWAEAKKLINETMGILSGKVGYAGLDIAITPKGPVLIEANSHAHLHRIEFFYPKNKGNRRVINEYVN